jgi:hypothetical protein
MKIQSSDKSNQKENLAYPRKFFLQANENEKKVEYTKFLNLKWGGRGSRKKTTYHK